MKNAGTISVTSAAPEMMSVLTLPSGCGTAVGPEGQGLSGRDDTNASICWRTSLGLLMIRS